MKKIILLLAISMNCYLGFCLAQQSSNENTVTPDTHSLVEPYEVTITLQNQYAAAIPITLERGQELIVSVAKSFSNWHNTGAPGYKTHTVAISAVLDNYWHPMYLLTAHSELDTDEDLMTYHFTAADKTGTSTISFCSVEPAHVCYMNPQIQVTVE